MTKQLFEHGETFKVKGHEFEVAHISSQFDSDGKPVRYHYEFTLKSDADEKRAIEEAAAQKAEQEAAERQALIQRRREADAATEGAATTEQ